MNTARNCPDFPIDVPDHTDGRELLLLNAVLRYIAAGEVVAHNPAFRDLLREGALNPLLGARTHAVRIVAHLTHGASDRVTMGEIVEWALREIVREELEGPL